MSKKKKKERARRTKRETKAVVNAKSLENKGQTGKEELKRKERK